MNFCVPYIRIRCALLVFVLAAAAGLEAYCAATSPVRFEAFVGGRAKSVSTQGIDVQGVVYLSVPELVRQLGGSSRVLPARVQIDLGGRSALLAINDTRVTTSQRQFFLQHPVVLRDGQPLVAGPDVSAFLSQGFGVALATPTPTPTPAPTPALPEPPAGEEPQVRVRELGEDDVPALPVPVTDPQAPREPVASETVRLSGNPSAVKASELAPSVETRGQASPLSVVVLDPGHGGHDTGCTGGSGTVEKDLVMAITQHVRRLLKESSGIRTFVTRSEDRDVTPQQRVNLANQQGGELLISIHAGVSHSPRAHGFEVFCPAPDRPAERSRSGLRTFRSSQDRPDFTGVSRRYGEAIGAAMAESSSASPCGVREVPLRIYSSLAMPAVLVEVGFLSNPAEEALLATEAHQIKIARGIAAGIRSVAGKAPEGGGT